MIIIDIETAGPQLDSLIDRALAGEEIVLGRNGQPLARLVPFAAAPDSIPPG
jgi:prevent-host-death family protein